MNEQKESHFMGVEQLTLRAVVIGMLGSVIITASSMYVALKMSALPWPTVFVAVLSMALLKILGKTNLNEINIAQTGMSAGAMVAGGLAFTIPGLWIAKVYTPYNSANETFAAWFWPKFWPVLMIAAAGMILGSLLCWYMRPRFIDQDKLPYPIGTAAAETLQSGDQGGRKAALLFSTLGLTAIFTAIRDKVPKFPQNISGKLGDVSVGLYLSPMAVGIGYIIGLNYTAYWFAGAVFTSFVVLKLGVGWGAFADAAAASAFNSTAAIGLMVGSGAGILLSFLKTWGMKLSGRAKAEAADKSRAVRQTSKRKLSTGLLVLISVAAAYVLTLAAGIGPAASLLLMLGVLAATAMSANITGLTGINPMEVFGIIILLAVRLFVTVDATGAFMIAAAVAVACGYAGDLLNDYKTGAIIGTNPNAQLVSQIFGGVIGTLVASLAMFAVIYQYGGVGGSTGLSAAQAFSVTAMVNGIGDNFVFLVAALLGCALYLCKIPAMIVGIGMLLSFNMSAAIFLGGLIRAAVDFIRRKKPQDNATGNIIAAGMLGGEGITGVILAIITMFS
ncbi:MAG: OPT/YSL family transporter [Clostridiaceae bacterium]|nr:OPT/YSL family transporter [Clostridiaceae bacterium]